MYSYLYFNNVEKFDFYNFMKYSQLAFGFLQKIKYFFKIVQIFTAQKERERDTNK